MPDSNISDSMAESIFNNEIIQNMTDETFDKILDVIGFTVPNILRDIPVFKYVVSLYSLSSDKIVDMMLIEDVKELIDIFEQGKNHKYDYARCFRLQALGMLTGGITVYCGESQVDKFYLTDMGKGLCNMIIDNSKSENNMI